MTLQISMIGGNCPVQAEGTIGGKPFYFRARGQRWSLEIENELFRSEPWGSAAYTAGWMPEAEARRLIEWCASEYAQNAARASPAAVPGLEAIPGTPEGETGAQREIYPPARDAGEKVP